MQHFRRERVFRSIHPYRNFDSVPTTKTILRPLLLLSPPPPPSPRCSFHLVFTRSSSAMSGSVPLAVNTSLSPAALGAYSQAIRCPHNCSLLFISGQLGLDVLTSSFVTPASVHSLVNRTTSALNLPPPPSPNDVTSDVQAQTYAALRNMQNILAAADASTRDVVKTTILLTDMANFEEVNKVYAMFFPCDVKTDSPPPARACFAVKELPKQALVEIEAVAAVAPAK
eukprot:GHVS01024994.1.p1 GENE.GHVS01024994.1~~GHVS01024994.1.p1  ORF type:complete len:227 (-),score=32.42 GHVS01024994.1:206-886(-)